MGKFLFNNSLFYRSIRHSTFFVVTILLFTLVVFLRTGKDNFLSAFYLTSINAIFFFSYGYLTIFLLVPKVLFKRFYVCFALAFIASGFALSFLKFLASDYVFESTIVSPALDDFNLTGWRMMLVNTKDMSFIVALFAVAKFSKDWLYAERLQKLVESKNAEARLKVLQSQFDPHFLFNTLNNLYALSLKESDETVTIIRKLKKVLKYLLVDNQGQVVVLKDEVKLIENYIDIEQIRYGNRLHVDFEKKATDCSLEIAPMLLFPIIENCFKHGSSIDAGSPWIKLKLACDDSRIIFEARNSKPVSPSSFSLSISGSGLDNLIKRLELLYPDRYMFKVDNLKHEFNVFLEIKVK